MRRRASALALVLVLVRALTLALALVLTLAPALNLALALALPLFLSLAPALPQPGGPFGRAPARLPVLPLRTATQHRQDGGWRRGGGAGRRLGVHGGLTGLVYNTSVRARARVQRSGQPEQAPSGQGGPLPHLHLGVLVLHIVVLINTLFKKSGSRVVMCVCARGPDSH